MRKKKLLSLLLVGTMVAGLITGCGSSSKDTSKSDSGKSKGGKVVLNVINYHVGTDYAAVRPPPRRARLCRRRHRI